MPPQPYAIGLHHPNTAEAAKAVGNVATVGVGAAKGIGLVKNSAKTVSNSKVGIEWGKGINKQGMPWESYVGKDLPSNARLPKNFKTFDYYNRSTGTAISAKTLDTQTSSRISNPNQIYNTMKKHIDSAANFKQYELSRIELRSNMINNREIHLAIPSKTNSMQRLEVHRAVDYGKSRNVKVIVTEVK